MIEKSSGNYRLTECDVWFRHSNEIFFENNLIFVVLSIDKILKLYYNIV